jgi:hypothetical protein
VFNRSIFRFEQLSLKSNSEKSIFDYESKLKEYEATNPPIIDTHDYIGKSHSFRETVNKFEDIPLNVSSSFRSLDDQSLINRFHQISKTLQDAIMKSYNTLNNQKYVDVYLKELFIESFDWMKKNSKDDLSKFFRSGTVSERAVAVVLIRRFKSRNDTRFTKLIRDNGNNTHIMSGKIKLPRSIKTNKNASFREAIKGPFIDGVFKDFFGHGAYAHMVQRDLIHKSLSEIYQGSPQHFYDFLGSKRGISFWADLFDSGETQLMSFSRPESINIVLRKSFFKN